MEIYVLLRCSIDSNDEKFVSVHTTYQKAERAQVENQKEYRENDGEYYRIICCYAD